MVADVSTAPILQVASIPAPPTLLRRLRRFFVILTFYNCHNVTLWGWCFLFLVAPVAPCSVLAFLVSFFLVDIRQFYTKQDGSVQEFKGS